MGSGLKARPLLLALALSGSACAKFQTARECGTFMDAIKAWKSQAEAALHHAALASPAGAPVEALALAKALRRSRSASTACT